MPLFSAQLVNPTGKPARINELPIMPRLILELLATARKIQNLHYYQIQNPAPVSSGAGFFY